MNIISFGFIILVFLTYIICLFTPKKYRWIVILISSIVFYYYAGMKSLFIIVAFSLFSYAYGIFLEKLPQKGIKRTALIIGIVLIIAWLCVIKYSIASGWKNRDIIIPLGISYVSFSTISYFVDIYWERDKADRNVLQHVLFVLFFPKISQGPIVRHKKTASYLYVGGDMSYKNFSFGCQRIIFGYFKKLVVVTRLSLITNNVFSDISSYSGSILLLSVFLAAMELYFDFSGYMDIILGIAQLFGFEMDENFNHPFLSRSVAEFWRRWHITLGAWFKDYVYTPIVMSHPMKALGRWAKKRGHKKTGNMIMKAIALLVVWILTGLWHGFGINYLIWGLFWGITIVMSFVFEGLLSKITLFLRINTKALSWRVFQSIRIFIVFSFGILLTRTESINEVKLFLRKVLYEFQFTDVLKGKLYQFGITQADFTMLLFFIIFIIVVSMLQERFIIRERIASLNSLVRWTIYAIGISVILFFGIYGAGYSIDGFAYTYF